MLKKKKEGPWALHDDGKLHQRIRHQPLIIIHAGAVDLSQAQGQDLFDLPFSSWSFAVDCYPSEFWSVANRKIPLNYIYSRLQKKRSSLDRRERNWLWK